MRLLSGDKACFLPTAIHPLIIASGTSSPAGGWGVLPKLGFRGRSLVADSAVTVLWLLRRGDLSRWVTTGVGSIVVVVVVVVVVEEEEEETHSPHAQQVLRGPANLQAEFCTTSLLIIVVKLVNQDSTLRLWRCGVCPRSFEPKNRKHAWSQHLTHTQ
jgi:hypothetical protein